MKSLGFCFLTSSIMGITSQRVLDIAIYLALVVLRVIMVCNLDTYATMQLHRRCTIMIENWDPQVLIAESACKVSICIVFKAFVWLDLDLMSMILVWFKYMSK